MLDAAEGLDTDTMQRFAAWTNLSETTFVLPPTARAAAAGADYRLRIFTPGGELPFAGHPTLGTAHAWWEAGGAPREAATVVQECGAGLVTVRRDGSALNFRAPDLIRSGPLEPEVLQRATQALGLGLGLGDVLDHQWVDNGPGWAALRLASAQDVLAVEVDPALLGDLALGVVPTPWTAICVQVVTSERVTSVDGAV